jgi:hypothetical protein
MGALGSNDVSDPTDTEIRRILVSLARKKALITYSELVKRVKNSKATPRIESLSVSRARRYAALGWPWGDRGQRHPDRPLPVFATSLGSYPPRLAT